MQVKRFVQGRERNQGMLAVLQPLDQEDSHMNEEWGRKILKTSNGANFYATQDFKMGLS